MKEEWEKMKKDEALVALMFSIISLILAVSALALQILQLILK